MRVRVNTLLVSCVLITVATVMLVPSTGIKILINTPNNLIAQSAGYGALAMVLSIVFVTWTGLIKSDWKSWVVILGIALLWEYPILARLYVEHYGFALALAVVHDLAFIRMESRSYVEVLLGVYGCLLTLAALVLSAISVFWGKGKQVKLGRGFVVTSVSILVVLLVAGARERLRESPIPPEQLNLFLVAPPPPPPPGNAELPICDPSVCSCGK